jgi:hypothetical protein
VDGAEVTVFVQRGAILGAQATDDDRLYLRRLSVYGALDDAKSRALYLAASAGESLFGRILDAVAPEVLDVVLLDRFRDNLARFVSADHLPEFQPSNSIFVDNLQIVDAEAELERATEICDMALLLTLDLPLHAGAVPPRDVLERQALDATRHAADAREAANLLNLEPWEARALLAGLVAEQVLSEGSNSPMESDLDDLAPHDDDTEFVEKGTPSSADERILPPTRRPEPDVDEPAATQAKGAGDLSSLSAWLRGSSTEDDMEAFADHDERGGTEAQGKFSTDAHNLDRVEVADTTPVAAPVEEIEAEAAPQANFGAPTLTDADAQSKLAVANDVLVQISGAFDDEQGPGAGRAAIQLLVDGSAGRFVGLLVDVQADEEGHLDERQILRNLRERPTTEHRRLLNEGFADLIERALSMAADELDGDTVDAMLERVAGYRHRIGL